MKTLSVIFFFLIVYFTQAQNIELAGAVVIGNSQMVTYKIVYNIGGNNAIDGFSISDIGGELETKSKISGYYNPKKKSLTFEETAILSTKSNLSTNEFCLMKVQGQFSKKNGIHLFSGSFVSKGFQNTLQCDSGTIYLTTNEDIFKLEEKVQKIISKSVSLPDTLKDYISEKAKPFKVVEQVKTLKAGSSTEFIILADTIQLEIYDDQKQDGDKITILKNNIPLLTDFSTTNIVKKLSFNIENEREVLLTVISTDEGSMPPNTVKMVLINGLQKVKLTAPLKKNQNVTIKLIRK